MITALEVLNGSPRATVVRAYSGRPGCGCGCRGTYQEKGRIVSDNLRLMRERPEAVRMTWVEDNMVCLALETEERYRWLYVRVAA
jgi:hypothetical protein